MNEPSLDVIDGFIKTSANIAKEFYKEDGDVWKAIGNGLRDISNISGIPIKNVYDLYKSIKGYAGDIKSGEFAHDITDYTSGNKSFYSYGDLASCISSGDKAKETKILDYYSANGKEISKGSLTKEIKPAYVQTYIDFPEKANYLKRKLILDYDYTEADINQWIYDEYFKNIVSDPEYSAEIKGVLSNDKNWDITSAFKTARSYYKKIYRDGDEKEIKALRESLLTSDVVSESTLGQWESEVNIKIENDEKKAEAEKEKFK